MSATNSHTAKQQCPECGALQPQPGAPLSEKAAPAQPCVVDALKLLEVAKCPSCDGSGGIPRQVGDYEWEQEQCQWCFERTVLLADSSCERNG